jgi:hypothetical protein
MALVPVNASPVILSLMKFIDSHPCAGGVVNRLKLTLQMYALHRKWLK